MAPEFHLGEGDVVYSASMRCVCGAGLCYWRDGGADNYWDCSDVMLGRAIPVGQPGAIAHNDLFPFSKWKFVTENSAGYTTRPEV